MKLYKKDERKLQTAHIIKSFKSTGFTVKNLGTWCKWKDLGDYGKLQVKMTVYEIKNDDITGYIVSDSLGRVAAPVVPDKKEVLDWLVEHGYKTEKKWYIEDYGMTESDWNYWNGLEER